jgi:hypothetical protein
MRRVHKTGDHAIGNAQVGSSPPTAIQDEDLMPSQRRFRDDGTKATRFYKPDDGDDHERERLGCRACRHRIKISKNPGIQADFVIRRRQPTARTQDVSRPREPELLGACYRLQLMLQSQKQLPSHDRLKTERRLIAPE